MQTRVLVVGAGIMGSGIAAQAALAGYPVTLVDVNEELARRGTANATRAMDHAVRKGTITSVNRDAALTRIDVGIGMRRAESAQIVVEAAPEDLELKRRLFAELETVTSPTALLASNTSSLPITAIGQHLKDAGRLVGVHFFNPVLQMSLVEIIPGHTTRPEIVERARTSPSRSARRSSSRRTRRGSSRPALSRCWRTKRRGCSPRGLRRRRTSTRPTSSASTTPWARSSSWTWSASTRPSRSWTSSGMGFAIVDTAPARSSAPWSRPTCWDGRAGRGVHRYPPGGKS